MGGKMGVGGGKGKTDKPTGAATSIEKTPGVPFVKMHGNGNDFVVVDEVRGELVPEARKARFAAWACHRRFGVGADGVLFVVPGRRGSAVGMRLLQPDGSEAEMCGNGLRCVARLARDRGYALPPFSVWTAAGIMQVDVTERGGRTWVRVDMGCPRFERKYIPAAGEPDDDFLEQGMEGETVSAVNTGVPHTVIFVEEFDFDVAARARPIRHHSIFTQGANVNFVRVEPDGGLRLRTFERGVEAETMSCGTGAVAAAAVARRLGRSGQDVLVRTEGGELLIILTGDTTFMDGGVEYAFDGATV